MTVKHDVLKDKLGKVRQIKISYSSVVNIVLSLYVLSSLSYLTHECKTSALIHAWLFDNCEHTVQVFIEYFMCLLTYALKTVRQTVEVMI